jgi:hypothetical protein
VSVIYSLGVRNNRLQQVINAIDGGAGNGTIKLGTSGMAVILSSIVLAKPSATILSSAAILVFSGLPLVDPSAAANGTAANGEITDSVGNIVVSGLTVGTAGTDIIINNTAVVLGEIVAFTSGTITGN